MFRSEAEEIPGEACNDDIEVFFPENSQVRVLHNPPDNHTCNQKRDQGADPGWRHKSATGQCNSARSGPLSTQLSKPCSTRWWNWMPSVIFALSRRLDRLLPTHVETFRHAGSGLGCRFQVMPAFMGFSSFDIQASPKTKSASYS